MKEQQERITRLESELARVQQEVEDRNKAIDDFFGEGASRTSRRKVAL